MRGWLLPGLVGLSLGLLASGVKADEWRPAIRPSLNSAASLQASSDPGAAVTLGKPIGIDSRDESRAAHSPSLGKPVIPASYHLAADEIPGPVYRAQAPDPYGPTLAPPQTGVFPATPEERYNSGVVQNGIPPAGGNGFWGGCQDFIKNCEDSLTAGNRTLFRSDHCFDAFISPVSNPFFFEDPRSLTEVRPIFMYQSTPSKNSIFRGGDVEFFGTQARLALTDRLSFVLSELGGIWLEPHNHIDGFSPHSGFAELHLGPKYTFIRSEDTGTLLAGGLTFAIPAGPSKVFQDTGNLSLVPYISFGQNFLRSSFGSFNFLNTTGYSAGVDNKRTDYLFSSFHLDYDILNAHRVYPLIELNWFHFTEAGNARPLGFEGRDLVNFGSTGVSGADNVSLALGGRYKFSEWVQTGIAAEFPLNGRHDLMDFRLTIDFILRY
jgi:hypothetical protein